MQFVSSPVNGSIWQASEFYTSSREKGVTREEEEEDGPVTRHFKSDDHSVADIHITGFDMLPGADMIALVNKETFWMKELQTALNSNRQLVYPIARFQ